MLRRTIGMHISVVIHLSYEKLSHIDRYLIVYEVMRLKFTQ